MKILLTGKNGQVGHELQRSLAPLGEVHAVGSAECDLAITGDIAALVKRIRPDLIVNPAAYTAVDKAETDPITARAVNGTAPEALALLADMHDIPLIHYSTDYVFDGEKTAAYLENDTTNPQSVYGRSKWEGEVAVRRFARRHVILRTSWVFGAHGGNFLKTILRLARERDSLAIVADQTGAPTSAALLADTTARIAARLLAAPADAPVPYGTYHLTSAGSTTWHGYACEVVEAAHRLGMPLRIRAGDIRPIATNEYPLPAPRPANSLLDTTKIRETFGLHLPRWELEAHKVVQQLAEGAA